MRAASLALRVVLIAVLAAVSPAAAAQPMVRAVEIRSDVAVDDSRDLLRWVAVELDRPLSTQAVARSLRNLHATGIASRLEVYHRPYQDGVAVVFVMHGKTLLEGVELEGTLSLKRRQLREALALGVGEPLLADRVFKSFYQLRQRYEDEGYLAASIRIAVEEDEQRRRAVVRFDIESGEPAEIGAIEFTGELAPLDAGELTAALRLKVGDRYRPRVVRDGRERLESWLHGRGYWQATVSAARELRHDTSRVDLSYAVTPGAHFNLELAPGSSLSRSQRALLPWVGGQPYDESARREVEGRLTEDLQTRGYSDAVVTLDEQREDGGVALVLAIEPGPRQSVEQLSLSGNETLGTERLLAVMRTSPRRFLQPGSGRLVESWLGEDLAALGALYALEGFGEAVIGPPQIVVSGDRLAVELPIVEGARRTVFDVTLEGVVSLDAERLLASLPLQIAGPYHRRRETEALNLIRGRYQEAGFALVQVVSKLDWSADGLLVSAAIEVSEGPQSRVERVIVRGHRHTRPEFLRAVLDLEPGTPVSQQQLLSLERQLYGLGIFSRVDVGLVPGTPFSGQRDVMVDVREGRRRRVSYGLGYDTEDGLRGLVGYSHGNLWGRAVSGRIDVRISERDRQARALLRQPFIGRRRVPLTYSLFSIEEEQESFRSLRDGAQVDFERVNGRSRWRLLTTYKTIEIDAADPGLELLLVDREFQEVAVTSVTPSLILDHRDDPIDPQRGWSATVLLERAFQSLGADERFTKLFIQHARYLPLGRAGLLAVNLRAGAIEPIAGAGGDDPICVAAGLDFPSCEVKISERFFAGGRTTHRAYRRDQLGILGSTLLEVEGEPAPVSIGGTGLLLANLDYRFPIAAGVGGTLFIDAGNLWADWSSIDPSELKLGAGVGVRYASPIGPVRLEVGWKLDRLPNESSSPVVLFSFGNPF